MDLSLTVCMSRNGKLALDKVNSSVNGPFTGWTHLLLDDSPKANGKRSDDLGQLLDIVQTGVLRTFYCKLLSLHWKMEITKMAAGTFVPLFLAKLATETWACTVQYPDPQGH